MTKVNIKRVFSFCLCFMFILSLGGCIKFSIEQKKIKKASSITTIATTTETTTSGPKADDKLIALTFDDGPYSPVDEKLFEVFKKYNIVATFYVVGDRCQEWSDSLKKATELGCEIGSHTYSHQNITKISASEIKSQMQRTDDVVFNITGKHIKTMRPPEGAVNDESRNAVNYPMIIWSVDSLDWKYRNADADYNQVVNSVTDGSIILMHDLYDATAEAVGRFVPKLISDGYRFVTVSQLLELRKVEIINGKSYFDAPNESSQTTTTEAEYSPSNDEFESNSIETTN